MKKPTRDQLIQALKDAQRYLRQTQAFRDTFHDLPKVTILPVCTPILNEIGGILSAEGIEE